MVNDFLGNRITGTHRWDSRTGMLSSFAMLLLLFCIGGCDDSDAEAMSAASTQEESPGDGGKMSPPKTGLPDPPPDGTPNGQTDEQQGGSVMDDPSSIVAGDCRFEPRTQPVGEHCGCTDDCVAGAACFTEANSGFPHGECIMPCASRSDPCPDGTRCVLSSDVGVSCNGTCEQDGDCSVGRVCIENACCQSGVCQRDCAYDSDCASGRYCSINFCLAFCEDDSDCDSLPCDPDTNLCTKPFEGAGTWEPCDFDADCRSNRCVFGYCMTSCTEKGGCPEGMGCVVSGTQDVVGDCFLLCDDDTCPSDFRCTDSPNGRLRICLSGEGCPAEEREAGEPCVCENQCAAPGRCAPEAIVGVPGGICSHSCDDQTECPPGFSCLADRCWQNCEEIQDCRQGFFCLAGSCYPGCQSNSDCQLSFCDAHTGDCVPKPPDNETTDALSPCSVDSDCRSGYCSDTSGRCIVFCSVSRQGCPGGAACIQGPDNIYDDGICIPRCETQADCDPSETVCADFSDTQRLCLY